MDEKDKKRIAEKVAHLKDLIGIQLDQCDSFRTPVVCANANSGDPEARQNLIDLIFDICMASDLGVEEAIDMYERTFNPNMAN